MKLEVGDVIKLQAPDYEVLREITEVRSTGYTWRYPDDPDGPDWWSENSNDPFFDWGWELVER